MLSSITTAIESVLSWIGSVITSLVTGAGTGTSAGALNPLLPLFAVGIAISAILLGVKVIKKVVWGA